MPKISFKFVVLSVLLGACSLQTPTTSSSDLSVVGPHIRPAAAGEFASAVAIRFGNRPHCTGILVAPNLVLTAAHCVNATNVRSLKVHTGLGNEPDFGAQGVAVNSFGVSPNYRNDVGGNSDVAYLVLASALDDVPMIPIASDPEELRVLLTPGSRSMLVGYGAHDNDVVGTLGQKYLGPATVKAAFRNEVWIGDTQGDGCTGDSGGPVFGQLPSGEWRVFGVTSRGPSPCGLDEWPGIWGLIHAHICWIEAASGIQIPSSTLDCSLDPTPQTDFDLDFSNLAQLCSDPSLSPGLRRTLSALRVVYAEQTTGAEDRAADVSCDDLAAWASQITHLNLSRLMISDVRPLLAFHKLQNLNLEDNFIKDLAMITTGLENLRVLHIGWNDLGNRSPLDQRIASGLKIHGLGLQTPAPDFSSQTFEAQCQAATKADAPPEHARNIDIFRRHLCYNRLCTCDKAARNLNASRMIDLSGSEVTSLEPLRGAHGVQYLKISDTQLSDVSALQEVENLKYLDISGSRVTDLSPLDHLIHENTLHIVGQAEAVDAPTTRLNQTKTGLEITIPEAVEANQAAVIPLEIEGDGLIQGIGLKLRFHHNSPTDLIIRLVHPNGKYVNVARRPTAVGPEFTAYFSFGQSEGIRVRELQTLKRLPAAGTWKLLVHDVFTGSAGTITSVDLSLDVAK